MRQPLRSRPAPILALVLLASASLLALSGPRPDPGPAGARPPADCGPDLAFPLGVRVVPVGGIRPGAPATARVEVTARRRLDDVVIEVPVPPGLSRLTPARIALGALAAGDRRDGDITLLLPPGRSRRTVDVRVRGLGGRGPPLPGSGVEPGLRSGAGADRPRVRRPLRPRGRGHPGGPMTGRRALGALLLAAGGLAVAGAPAAAGDFTVQGRFQYEDRIWDPFGYTGTVQDLPIRHADVQVVNASTGQVLASGSTDADGNYAVPVTGLAGSVTLYARCLSRTDLAPDYHIKVVTTFTRVGGTLDLTGSSVHAVTTATVSHDTAQPVRDLGAYVIQDATGSGTAQAFNILDNAVDAFDYLASPGGIGRYPGPGEFVVYGWNGTSGSSGSNYYWQGIYVVSTSTDTDGWSDTVILHETGHWASDMFSRDHNPGGTHYIGDVHQDPRLSYGEGYATFFCAQVREFRSSRLNGSGQPVDGHVSFYADLSIPPPVGTPGGLEFAYDFETGLYEDGTPIGEVGTACETNVTSAQWDLVDGPGTADESPGVDDEPADDDGSLSWAVLTGYLPTLSAPAHWITVEDFYRGWFAVHGPGYLQDAVDSAFVGLAGMPFLADAAEPDDEIAQAPAAGLLHYSVSAGGGVVLNELDLGSEDKVELLNTGTAAVDLTGWKVKTHRNGTPIDATRTYTFGAFTLYPGSFAVIHEGGDPADDGPVHVYGGSLSIVWANGADGACILENASGAAMDFVRWSDSSGGTANTTPTPAGTGWSGTLLSPPGGKDLGRGADGADTDQAADFTPVDSGAGAPNFAVVPFHTLYPAGDRDVVRLDLQAGDLAVVRAYSPHSAGEPRVELLDATGRVLGAADHTYGLPGLAELQTYASADTQYFARITHVGPYTEYAPVAVVVYARPVAAVLNPPVALAAAPAHTADVADAVEVSWLNGGAYDAVRVRRDGGPPTTLGGGATSFTDAADRGLHTYTVTGVIAGAESAPATVAAFAGILDCTTSEDLESGAADFVLDAPWARTSGFASSGSWCLTDSPPGDYANNADVSATLVVPTLLTAYPRLEFDHICITEAGYDYGRVEVSDDYGTSWTELARWDMDSYPGWSDGIAGYGDWRHESLDLSDYVGEPVQIRFRLVTDGYVTAPGWWVDDVRISDPACRNVTAVPGDRPSRGPLLAAGPNPFSGALRLTVNARPGEPVSVEVFDVTGRRVRTLLDGPAAGDRISVVWDGRDAAGRSAAGGIYLVRARAGTEAAVRRVVRMP